MSILDVGTTGAKRVSWEHYNPRELLLELVQNYPNADEATIARHLRDRVLGDESEYLMSILLYYVRNNMRSLQPGRPSPAERAARHAEAITAVDAVKQQVREHIKREAMRVRPLLDGFDLYSLSEADAARAVANLGRSIVSDWPNVGVVALGEIEEWLAKHGLQLQ